MLVQIRFRFLTSAILALTWLGADQPAHADAIRLSTGEVLNVTILETTADSIRVRHPVLGELTLPRATVEILPAHTAGAGQVTADEAGAAATSAIASPPPVEPDPWKFKFTLAASAATGNSENFGVVTKFDAVRETPRKRLSIDSGYFYNESEGVTSENKFTAGVRHDWLNPDSKWFYFAQSRYDFDDFQSWDHRVSAHVGVGYKLIEPPTWRINLLGGVGAIKEWGSANDDVRPEGLFGVEGEWQIAEKHSLKFDSTIFPDLSEIGDFRWVNNVGYAVALDDNLSLTAGLAHEYQSNVAPDRKKNDLRVFAGVALDF